MKVCVLSIFPEIFTGFLESSLIKKARELDKLSVSLTNIRDFADPPHYQVDDTPYGGGAGMVMRPEPIIKAVESIKAGLPRARVILLTASGKPLTQETARRLSAEPELILICGRYEGVDQRVSDLVVDEEISIGDYILMGGEVAAMVLIETTARLVSDVLGNKDSIREESFEIQDRGATLLEGPQYTRPIEFRGLRVPEILASGDHARIANWRLGKAREKTAQIRPDLTNKNSHEKTA